MYSLLFQTNISDKNIQWLGELASIDDSEFQMLRLLVLEIATVHPRKRRRWQAIPQKHPLLFDRIVESELFDDLLDEFGSTYWDELEPS